MIETINNDIEELIQIFILSNTPHFLYKKFSAHPSINKLSQQFSTSELFDFFEEIQAKDKTTYEDISSFYAIIIALTKKPYIEVKSFFIKLPDASFRWARQISEIFIAKRKSESLITLNCKYKSDIIMTDFSSDTKTSIFNFENRPTIEIKE
jgi:hypothetical protein